MWCGVCFFSGGGDVRIGSVSGISSYGCDLDQLERTFTLKACAERYCTQHGPTYGQTQVKLHGGSTEARGIITHPVSISTRPIPPPYFRKERSDILSSILFCFFLPHRAVFFFFGKWAAGSHWARSGPSFHPAYNYRSFLSDRGCMCCATERGYDRKRIRYPNVRWHDGFPLPGCGRCFSPIRGLLGSGSLVGFRPLIEGLTYWVTLRCGSFYVTRYAAFQKGLVSLLTSCPLY